MAYCALNFIQPRDDLMPNFQSSCLLLILTCAALAGCGSDAKETAECPAPNGGNEVLAVDVRLNPHGNAPLSAVASLDMRAPAGIEWQLEGKDGRPSDVHQTVSACLTHHEFEILGLYADHANGITIRAINAGRPPISINVQVRTGPLPANFPAFRIDKQYPDSRPAFFLFDSRNSNMPVIVDRYGNIRWYLTVGGAKYGLQVLRNGNIGTGIAESSSVVEYTMFGELVHEWSVLPLFHNIHHDVYEKENGNFLVTADKVGLDTIEDFIVELDRQTGAIVKTWDLRQILPKRGTLVQDSRDWFHINAVIEDSRDNSIIVSGQRQGVVKITADNHLRWILAPPDGWTGYEQYLLTEIPSQDFEWNWGQHAPLLMPNGDLMLFDNGFAREYGAAAKYSRVVRYRITEDPTAGGTVQQIWAYGKNRGESLYSPIVSDIDFLPASNTYLMTSGAMLYNLNYVSPTSFTFSQDPLPDMAHILEIDESGQVLFEMAVLSNDQSVLLYRSEKVDLFPHD